MNKQEFDMLYVRKNTVIHCSTEELANQFLNLAHKFGYRWSSGESYLDNNNWKDFKEETCYNLYLDSHTDVYYYRHCGYNIIEFNGFNQNQEVLSYKDLKENVVYQHIENKDKFIIKNHEFNFIEMNSLYIIHDISWFIKGKYIEVVEDKKEMTIEEIEKELGHKIKIVNKNK